VLNEIDGPRPLRQDEGRDSAIIGNELPDSLGRAEDRFGPDDPDRPDKNGNYTTSAPQTGGYQLVNARLCPSGRSPAPWTT